MRDEVLRELSWVIPVIDTKHEKGLRVAYVDGEEVVVQVAGGGVGMFSGGGGGVVGAFLRRRDAGGGGEVDGDDLASCAAWG